LYEVRDRRFGLSDVHIADGDGRDVRNLTKAQQAGTLFQWPAWGPDGTDLYFQQVTISPEERIRRVERMELATGERTVVLDDVIGPLDVSRDGEWLAAVRPLGRDVQVIAVNLRNGQERVLIPERQYETIESLMFDPSSQRLLLVGTPLGVLSAEPPATFGWLESLFRPSIAWAHGLPQDVYVIPLAGGNRQRVAERVAETAAWSPDGSHLAVFSIEGLSTLPVSGGSTSQVLAPGGYGTVDWAP
jgi:Tol biopolymer transport system component